MRRVRRPSVHAAALAAALTAVCVWIAWSVPGMGDYAHELRPALGALLAGDPGGFANAAPPYAGSVVPRLPFAGLAHALGGGDLTVYRAGVLPILVAVVALACGLEAQMRRAGRPAIERAAVVAVLIVAPVVLRALRDGHPEDVLTGVLCVAAVLLAARDRAALAGAALGLAIAGKPWAVLALAPALAVAPRRRFLLAGVAGVVATALIAPLLLLAPIARASTRRRSARPARSSIRSSCSGRCGRSTRTAEPPGRRGSRR